MRRIVTALALALGIVISLLTAPVAQSIVNGDSARTNPGVVSLYTDSPYRNRCTGTLVDDEQGSPKRTRWVLTAAHCVYAFTDPAAGRVTARVGSTDNTAGYVAIQAVPGQFWYNPGFHPSTLAYDVMLVLLEAETPEFAPDGTPVQVMKWRKPSLPVGAVAQAYGWGWVCDGPPGLSCSTWYAGALQRMNALRLPDSECATPFHESQVCFVESGGGDAMACLGDSGGPIKTLDFDGTPILSWSIVGDGDRNWDSCLYGVDGAPGRGLAIDIGRDDVQEWMGDVMSGSALSTLAALPPPTPRVLALLN